MTLREIFNAILDHPIQFETEFDPWAIGAGVAIVLIVLIGVLLCSSHYDGDNGWHI